jgi:hypothetical protein
VAAWAGEHGQGELELALPADDAVLCLDLGDGVSRGRSSPIPFGQVDEAGLTEELARETLTVDGHEAVRVEARATAGGFLPEGTLITSYRVDVGERTLIATSHDVGEPGYEVKQDALDAMMATLRFIEPGSAGE